MLFVHACTCDNKVHVSFNILNETGIDPAIVTWNEIRFRMDNENKNKEPNLDWLENDWYEMHYI